MGCSGEPHERERATMTHVSTADVDPLGRSLRSDAVDTSEDTIARYGRDLLPGADRRRAALYEPFLALAPDVGHVPPGEIGGRDAPEHGAPVEPIETVAERVPRAPQRERGFRLAARHQVAGKEGETLAVSDSTYGGPKFTERPIADVPPPVTLGFREDGIHVGLGGGHRR